MTNMRKAAGAMLLTAVLMSGCSGMARQGREHVVFQVQSNLRVSQRGYVDEVIDVGLARFRSVSARPVTLRSIRLVGKPAAVHLAGVRAFSCRLMHGCVLSTIGDMTRECPRQFKSLPLSQVVVRPHQYSDWQAVVAIRVSRPGRYYLGRVRIDYTEGGVRGWQYQNLWFTAIVANPPHPDFHMKPSECPTASG